MNSTNVIFFMKDIYFSVQNTVTALLYLINIMLSYNNVNYFFQIFKIATIKITMATFNNLLLQNRWTSSNQTWHRRAYKWIQVRAVVRRWRYNLTKVRPLFTLSHRGSDNSPLLIVFMWTWYELCVSIYYVMISTNRIAYFKHCSIFEDDEIV